MIFKIVKAESVKCLELTNGSLILKTMYSTFLESKAKSWLEKKQINAKGIIMFSGPN